MPDPVYARLQAVAERLVDQYGEDVIWKGQRTVVVDAAKPHRTSDDASSNQTIKMFVYTPENRSNEKTIQQLLGTEKAIGFVTGIMVAPVAWPMSKDDVVAIVGKDYPVKNITTHVPQNPVIHVVEFYASGL